MDEFSEITEYIQEMTGDEAEVIFGHGIDVDFVRGRLGPRLVWIAIRHRPEESIGVETDAISTLQVGTNEPDIVAQHPIQRADVVQPL